MVLVAFERLCCSLCHLLSFPVLSTFFCNDVDLDSLNIMLFHHRGERPFFFGNLLYWNAVLIYFLVFFFDEL